MGENGASTSAKVFGDGDDGKEDNDEELGSLESMRGSSMLSSDGAVVSGTGGNEAGGDGAGGESSGGEGAGGGAGGEVAGGEGAGAPTLVSW